MKKLTAIFLCCLLLAGCKPTAQPQETTLPAAVNTTVPTEPVTTPPTTLAPELTTILVYYPDDNAEFFLTQEIQGENLTILDALIQAGVLNENIQINEIAWLEEGSHIQVDFNDAFRDLICTMGTSGERMIMGSVVNTFLTAEGATTMTVTINGETWESGHVVYDFPMEFFE